MPVLMEQALLSMEKMKITVINGNMHHGSAWHCKDPEVTEFYLPLPKNMDGLAKKYYNGRSYRSGSFTPIQTNDVCLDETIDEK